MASKLFIDTLKVESFEPVHAAANGGVHGYVSGQYGPDCATLPSGCGGSGCGPSSPIPCPGGGQTSRCV